jgi:hypothetical protein
MHAVARRDSPFVITTWSTERDVNDHLAKEPADGTTSAQMASIF